MPIRTVVAAIGESKAPSSTLRACTTFPEKYQLAPCPSFTRGACGDFDDVAIATNSCGSVPSGTKCLRTQTEWQVGRRYCCVYAPGEKSPRGNISLGDASLPCNEVDAVYENCVVHTSEGEMR